MDLGRRREDGQGRGQAVPDLSIEVDPRRDVQGRREPDEHEGERGQEKGREAAGQAHNASDGEEASKRYPRPRRVWTTRGPWASSLRRSSITWTSSVLDRLSKSSSQT